MDVVPILLVLIAVSVVALLVLIGTYKDFANRSGIPIISRRDLVVPPTAFIIMVLSVLLPFLLLVGYPLSGMNIMIIAAWIVPICLTLFCLLVVAGSLTLWIAYGRNQALKKCLLLSARMMLVPIIDSFWSSVAVFIAIEYASMAMLCGVALIGFDMARQTDLQSMIGTFLSPMLGLQLVIFFPLVGLPVAYYIYKRGPSEALSTFYLVVGYGFLIVCFIGAAYVYFSFGQVSLMIAGFLILSGMIVSSINVAISRLYHYLRVTGVFGLELTCFSLLLLFLTHEAEQVRNTPIIGQALYELIPNLFWSIGYEVGIIGFISGILVLVLARNQPEKGQVMTRAMAITIGISTFVPIITLTIPIPYVGRFVGGSLAFLLVSPIYVLAVNIIRASGALKVLIGTRPVQKRCPNCGRKNKPQANFCGKCGTRL
jgi:hypothetical protein